jgi:hypothetical protein
MVLTAKYFQRIEKAIKKRLTSRKYSRVLDFGYETSYETKCLNGFTLKIKVKYN